LTILKALKIIKKKLNFKLLIVGSGTYKIKLEKFINKENMSHCVKIIPFQKNPFKFIKKADLFILSSKFEGLPNVLLEAQTLKKYIISTNCPTGPNEILSGGSLGDLVKVKDYKKLALKIMWFSKNKNKKIISKRIDTSFKKLLRFDYNLNMKKYKQVVEKYIHY
jgi:glycosyltransferase involved in cell wall biosynthesis